MKRHISLICLIGVISSSCSVFNLPTTPKTTPVVTAPSGQVKPPKEKITPPKAANSFLGRDSVLKALGKYEFIECHFNTNGDPDEDFQFKRLDDRLYALKGVIAEYMLAETGPAIPQFGFRMVSVYPMDALFYTDDIKKRDENNKNDLGLFWNEKKNQYELNWTDTFKKSYLRTHKMNLDKSLTIFNEQKMGHKYIAIQCSLKKI